MKFTNVRWRVPNKGYVKVNVNGFFFEEPLENGNVIGVGVVIRNRRGKILRMLTGTMGIQERRIKELYALMEGLKHAFPMDEDFVELETNNAGALWEWRRSGIDGVAQDHSYIVQQLNQREADDNLVLHTRPVDRESNEMTRYLARYGAENFTCLVVTSYPLGRIHQIWSHDMGLGPVGDQFNAIHLEDLEDGVVNEGMNVEGEEVALVEDEHNGPVENW